MTTKPTEYKSATHFVNTAFKTMMDAPIASDENLRIVGGQIKEDQLTAFLQSWKGEASSGFVWAMIEDVDKFDVQKINSSLDGLVQDNALLERMRLFGETGDLDIRRERKQFHWRYIGDKTAVFPDLSSFSAVDFWHTDSTTIFREVTRSYYQWRDQDERVDTHWYATTDLPQEGTCLQQKHYLQNGRIAFVRYVNFEEV